MDDRERTQDFVVCPHCWQVNPPSRYCARCLADMTLLLQESGGARWAAPVQSPVPVRGRTRLSVGRRRVLLGAVLLYGLAQLAMALGGGAATPPQPTRPIQGVP